MSIPAMQETVIPVTPELTLKTPEKFWSVAQAAWASDARNIVNLTYTGSRLTIISSAPFGVGKTELLIPQIHQNAIGRGYFTGGDNNRLAVEPTFFSTDPQRAFDNLFATHVSTPGEKGVLVIDEAQLALDTDGAVTAETRQFLKLLDGASIRPIFIVSATTKDDRQRATEDIHTFCHVEGLMNAVSYELQQQTLPIELVNELLALQGVTDPEIIELFTDQNAAVLLNPRIFSSLQYAASKDFFEKFGLKTYTQLRDFIKENMRLWASNKSGGSKDNILALAEKIGAESDLIESIRALEDYN